MKLTSSASQSSERLRVIDRCRLCGSTALVARFALRPTPPANAFSKRHDQAAPRYPLEVMQCSGCGHAQLGHEVDRRLLFENYLYASGVSAAFVRHFENLADRLILRLGLQAGDVVVDIGSNDGTLVEAFSERGMHAMGVEPAMELANEANRRGNPTIPLFFTHEMATGISSFHDASLVTANNVFAHVHDLGDFVDGVREVLAPDGSFVFEVAYLRDLIEQGLIDTIYHEHLDYHSIGPLRGFFEAHGLQLYDVERIPTHGGSIRGYVGHYGEFSGARNRVVRLVAEEDGLSDEQTWYRLGRRLVDLQGEWTKFITTEGNLANIAAYGASAKGTTLLHQLFQADVRIVHVIDDSPLKQGRYVPGTAIPILSAGQARALPKQADYILVTAWNLADEILAKLSDFRAAGGRVIIPLPKWQIV